jgi:hypothetical protein
MPNRNLPVTKPQTMRLAFLLSIFLQIVLTGCSVFRENSKYNFTDGRYKSTDVNKISRTVYVDYEGETIVVYPLRKTATGDAIDTAHQKPLMLGTIPPVDGPANYRFRQNSLDVDFLTIPFKHRFRIGEFPRQFTTNLNGAVYLGYRSDVYVLHYPTNLLGKTSRNITHAGFSFGVFTGFGGTAMNPWVTNNAINIEYDGVVWSKGVAAIIGLNNFSTGFAFGWDHLADRNRKVWIYQAKPWIGVVFGLNLN